MTADAWVAVDLGAQSGRVMLGVYTADGLDLTEVHRFANTPVRIDGIWCWDAERLFDDTLAGLAAAMRIANERGLRVQGIAVDSWGVDYGLIDAEGRLAAPVRHYRSATAEVMEAARSSAPADWAYARAGIVELPINTAFQLHRDASLRLLDGDVTALLIPDLWTFWLCGARGAERSIASTTGLLDRRTGRWCAELLDALAIPPRVLPALCDAGIAGRTTPEITERIGAVEPVPVLRTLGHDTACAFASVADADDGRAVVSCGTWALVGCVTGQPVLTEEARALGFTNEIGADGATILIRNLSGTWLLEECLAEWQGATGEPIASLRDRLLTQAAGLPSTESVIDVGSVELLEPGSMPARISALHERTLAGTGSPAREPAEVVRLIIDSLAAAFADTVRVAARLTGRTLTELHMIGGGSGIALLVDRTAAATGLPVIVGHREATSMGNICVQAVASGMMPTVAAARQRTKGTA